MSSFRDILSKKVLELSREVSDFAEENETLKSGSTLSPDLLRELLTFKLDLLPRAEQIPNSAHLYRMKVRETELMRRKKFTRAWEEISPTHLKYYGIFANLGEWDFGPKDPSGLKKRFRRLMRKTHPDVNSSQNAHEQTQQLLEAFQFLQEDKTSR